MLRPHHNARSFSSVRQRLARWLHCPLEREYEWQFFPAFWSARDKWLKMKFRAGRVMFGIGDSYRSARQSSVVFRQILGTVVRRFFFALALVIALELLERGLSGHVQPVADAFRLSNVGQGLGDFVARHRPSTTSYANVATILAQIAGIFLGLYFTAVSVVVSTGYAHVHDDVRDLMVREKVGDIYIRVVALLGADAVILLSAAALGIKLGYLNFVLLALLGVFSIYGFVVLGVRAFHFFNPIQLAGYLTNDVAAWIRRATCFGFQWQSPSFQAYYQLQAEAALTTQKHLVQLSNREQHSAVKSLTTLGLRALGELSFYIDQKNLIPSESHWFRKTPRHRNWLTTSYAQVDIALRTGTTVQPEIVPDMLWFERQAVGVVKDCMTGLVSKKCLDGAIAITEALQDTVSKHAEWLQLDEALVVLREIAPLIWEEVPNTETTKDGKVDEENLQLGLALSDYYLAGLIGVLLGLSKRLCSTTADSLSLAVAEIDWRRERSFYRAALPRTVLKQIEDLQRKLMFERSVEGQVITPLWYLQQLTALAFVRMIESVTRELVGELETSFADRSESLVSASRHVLGVGVAQRGLEACNKFHAHLEEFQKCVERLSFLRRIKDIPWPNIAWPELQRRVGMVRDRLIGVLSRSVPALAALPRSDRLPDYFGQAYSVLADECYDAMARGKDGLFASVFPSFFMASLSAQQRLRAQLSDGDQQTAIIFSTEPVADLLTLSGYAVIYSELDGKAYRKNVFDLWDQYLGQHEDPNGWVKYLLSVVKYRDSLLAILPRDLRRTSWEQDCERRLRARGVLTDWLGRPYLDDGPPGSTHPSPVIRALTRSDYSLYCQSDDVFMVVYLINQRGFDSQELPARALEFRRALDEEESADGQRDARGS
jgi:hypothetical protein